MLVFIDTEFTDFHRIDLISIGMVTDAGGEFYAERIDYRLHDCNSFVLETVVPLLGKLPNAVCTQTELTQRLRRWFGSFPEPTTVVFDYYSDWDLLALALAGCDDTHVCGLINNCELVGDSISASEVFEQAHAATYTVDWPRHHALADARALRAGYQAYMAEMERIWSQV
jgi:hypothetical protein